MAPPEYELPKRRPEPVPKAAAVAHVRVWDYVPLFMSVALYGTVGGLFTMSGGGRPGALLLSQFATAACCALWVTRDARHRRHVPCFEFGTFVLFTFGASVPIYLVWSRGWMGAVLVGALFAVMVGASLVASIAAAIARLL